MDGNQRGQNGVENAFLLNLQSEKMKPLLTEDSDISLPLTDQGQQFY